MDQNTSGSGSNIALVISGQGSEVGCVLNPPIYLHGEYEMCMISLQTYNTVPNITSANNVLRYYSTTPRKPNAWIDMVIPVGTYDIVDLERYIDGKLKEQEDNFNYFTLTVNSNTMRVNLKASVSIDFRVPNSIGPTLGFHQQIIDGNVSKDGDELVNINKVSGIDIMCNVVDGSYINGALSHILYHFYPNVPPGFKIIEVPQEKIYMPVNTNVLSEVIIRAVDQTGQAIELRGEELTVYLMLRLRN